jgi:uncharacterized protein YjbI with pentapeptide repeats
MPLTTRTGDDSRRSSHHSRAERLFTREEKLALRGLVLRSTRFDSVDLSGADLSYCIFENVSLVGCDFRGATLAFATFQSCDLRGALFDRKTVFSGSRFDGSVLLGARGLDRSARAHVRMSGGLLLASFLG